MRILIYSYNYHPELIGIAPLMTELAEGLVRRDHQVRVVTAMPWYPDRKIPPAYRDKLYLSEQINGVTIERSYIRVNGGGSRSLLDRFLLDASFFLSSFLQPYKGWQPEVTFFTTPPLPICILVYLLKQLRGTRVVLNLQDIVSEAAVRTGHVKEGGLLHRALESLEKFAYSTSDIVSVIDDKFQKKLVAQGVRSDKIVTIPNWVNVNFIKPLPKEENNEFLKKNELNGKFVLLYAGNRGKTQPLEVAIEAAASLQHIKEIVLAIVTQNNARQELEEFSQQLGADNVKVLPFEPREQLPQMLAAADVLLVLQKANVTDFNMPSKIPVYLASGRPIIASVPLGGTAATSVKQSGGGVAVEPENSHALAAKIEELYKNPELVKRLSEQGRQHAVDYYSLDIPLSKYEELFAELTAATNSDRANK